MYTEGTKDTFNNHYGLPHLHIRMIRPSPIRQWKLFFASSTKSTLSTYFTIIHYTDILPSTPTPANIYIPLRFKSLTKPLRPFIFPCTCCMSRPFHYPSLMTSG